MSTATKRRKAAKRRAPHGRREPGNARRALSEQLAAHAVDAAALACLLVAILSGLGVWTRAAGPLGHGIDTGFGAVFGRGRFLVPAACFAVGIALLTTRREEPESRGGVRLGLGCVLVIGAAAGLLHISGGHSTSEGLTALRSGGGMVGAFAGGGAVAVAGTVGAAIVLSVAVAFGILLVLGITLRQVAHGAASGVRWGSGQARGLVELRERRSEPEPDVDAQFGVDLTLAEALEARDAKARQIEALYDQELDLELDDEEDEEDEEEEEYEELDEDEEYEEEEEDEEYEEEDEEYEEVDEDEEYEEEEEEEEEEEVDDALVASATAAAAVAESTAEQRTLELGPGYKPTVWKLPAASLLKRGSGKQIDERLVDAGGEVLEATMREFGVDARLIGRAIGPTVTRYELELAAGVKVNKVTGLTKEIAYAMASHDVRILAPIPGRSAIGVEVPNKIRPLVTLGDILAADEAKKATHALDVGMGRDISGQSTMANLAAFPHVLIAGQTGAGKSSCINSIVTSLLMRTTPDQVRLILVDPKRVELGQYNNVPHLLTEVVVNPKKAANALEWAVREMEMRYDLLAEVGVRDITGYNALWDRGDLPTPQDPDPVGGKNYERLPFIVIVVDELADLMMVAARDVESSIARLAQMARAVGIHLVIATQRPSVDVITGVIKANIPSRLAFAVSSLTDSRVILDQPGAEKLVGKGDMLMLSASSSRCERIQGAWVDESCVRKVVAHWRRQAMAPSYVDGVQGDDAAVNAFGETEDEGDELLEQAMELVVRSGLGSTSMLQRKLRVGFARAGRLMDLLERRGIVGPSEGSKARSVMMSVDELEDLHART